MILSDRDLRAAIERGDLLIDPFEDKMVQPSSIDLTVDNQFRVFNNSKYPYIDVRQEMEDLTTLVEVKVDRRRLDTGLVERVDLDATGLELLANGVVRQDHAALTLARLTPHSACSNT